MRFVVVVIVISILLNGFLGNKSFNVKETLNLFYVLFFYITPSSLFSPIDEDFCFLSLRMKNQYSLYPGLYSHILSSMIRETKLN